MISEIKDIPEHWELKKLGEVCDIKNGKNQKAVVNPNGKYPIYGSAGVMGYANDFLCEEGATIIGRKGTINKPIYVNTKFWNVDTAFGFSPYTEIIDSKFLFFFCQSFNFHKLDKSTTIPSLAKTDLLKIQLVVPPLQEQQAIVAKIEELLSELDNGKQQLQTALQQLKVYRQSLLKWAFEGKLTNDNVKEGELPDGWQIEDLRNVCLIKRGKSKHRPRNEPSLFGGKYPFIQTGDVRAVNGGYIKNYSQTYSEFGLSQSKLWPTGTLCITIAANIGETAILGFDACFPDSVVGLLCNESYLLNKYANYFFVSHKSKLEKLAPATAQKNINVDILEKVKIPLPSLDEQQLIVDELESKLTLCDKVEETINQSLQQAETLRQSILKQAFAGKLV